MSSKPVQSSVAKTDNNLEEPLLLSQNNHDNVEDQQANEGTSSSLRSSLPSSTANELTLTTGTSARETTSEGTQEVSTSSASVSPPPPPPSLYRFVMLARPEFGMLFLVCLLVIMGQVAQLILPQMVGRAYDVLVHPTTPMDEKMPHINRIMATVLFIHVASSLAGGIRSSLTGIAGECIVTRLRNTLYSNILRQEIAFFDATKSGELISRLGSDTTVIKQAISNSWHEVLLGFIRLLASITLMFWISPQLAAVTIGSTFAIFLLCLPFGQAMGKLSKLYQDTLGEAQNYPTETIGAMRTVQSFAAEEREAKRYASLIGTPSLRPNRKEKTTFRIGFDLSIVRSAFGVCIFGGGFAAMYVSLWYGFYLVHHQHMTLGELTAFQSYIFLIGGILATISGSIANFIQARATAQRIFDLLDREPKILCGSSCTSDGDATSCDHDETRTATTTNTTDIEEQAAPLLPSDKELWKGTLHGSIAFHNVSFSYPTRPDVQVLHNFSLTIPKGQTTAIVGPSGTGKSTVLSLLERFYDAQQGSICIGGIDVRQMDIKALRRQIGFVQQEPTLFGQSLRDNIAYGIDDTEDNALLTQSSSSEPSASLDEQIMESIRKANAYEFISQIPNGLDELVGERGIKLSGGQKQRIAIARAILLNPPILLLDEATSALDAESEFLVQQAMDAASEGRTVIIVAHRLSTIKKANKIVVMDKNSLNDDKGGDGSSSSGGGGVADSIQDVGTHEELMGRCETYRNLIARQSMDAGGSMTAEHQ